MLNISKQKVHDRVHDECDFGFEITVCDLYFPEGGERTEYLLEDEEHLIGLQSIPEVPALCEELLQVELRTLHHDEGVLLLIVLVALHLGDQVAVVLDEPLALLRQLLHERDLLQEVLILVVVLYFDLLQGQHL